MLTAPAASGAWASFAGCGGRAGGWAGRAAALAGAPAGAALPMTTENPVAEPAGASDAGMVGTGGAAMLTAPAGSGAAELASGDPVA